MKTFRTLRILFKQTGANKIILGFFGFIIICALLIWCFEPTIETFGDSLWYCYAVVTTIGFGDILVSTLLARIVSVILSIYAVVIIAVITGIVVNFYTHITEARNKETITAFMDKLEKLPEMSREELSTLSENVKKFRLKGRSK